MDKLTQQAMIVYEESRCVRMTADWPWQCRCRRVVVEGGLGSTGGTALVSAARWVHPTTTTTLSGRDQVEVATLTHCDSHQHGTSSLLSHPACWYFTRFGRKQQQQEEEVVCYQLDTLAAHRGTAAVHSRCNSQQQTMGSGRKQVRRALLSAAHLPESTVECEEQGWCGEELVWSRMHVVAPLLLLLLHSRQCRRRIDKSSWRPLLSFSSSHHLPLTCPPPHPPKTFNFSQTNVSEIWRKK